MTLVREIGIAIRMAMVTLWLQSVGLVGLILWIRRALASDLDRLGPFALLRWLCGSQAR